MAVMASTPRNPGICKSISVTSGLSSRKRTIASAPSRASPTSVISDCVSRIAATPSRSTGWSSTTRMRIAASSAIGVHPCARVPPRQVRTPATNALRVGEPCRKRENHVGALARAAVDRERSADALGAFPHSYQTEMPFLAPLRQHGRRDADAVVANLDPKLAIAIDDCDIHRVCTRVARDVEQRLACDPPEFRRNKAMDLPWPSLDDDADRYGGAKPAASASSRRLAKGSVELSSALRSRTRSRPSTTTSSA